MAEIITLGGNPKGEDAPSNPVIAGIVEVLMHAVERARKGELVAVAVATVTTRGGVAGSWAVGKGIGQPALIGSVSQLLFEMNANVAGVAVDEDGGGGVA